MKIINLFLDFVIPYKCSLCGQKDMLSRKISICRNCYQPDKDSIERCKVCKTVLVSGECPYCSSRNVFFEELIYIRNRNLLEKKLIHRIKFGNEPALSYFFRLGLMKKFKALSGIDFSALVYIPSGKKTLKKRPYYFCKPVLEKLQKKLKVPVLCPVQKVSSELQSGKSYRDRFLHAARAFEIQDKYKDRLSGNYLLVDDIFTTGATVNEIAKLLLVNGADKIYLLMLTKVP